MHEQPIRADTCLSTVAVLGNDRPFGGGIEIGVVEHDERRVAAELQRQFLYRVGALAHQHAPGLGRAGEGQLPDYRIGAELGADRLRIAGDDIEHAFRNSRALTKLGQRERRIRRLPGGLDHHGATRGERRPGLARDHGVREVPRRDERTDADGLLHDEDALIRPRRRNRVAVGALAFFGEPFDERRAIGDLAARFRERLALLGGHDLRQVLLVRHHQVEPFAQDDGALLRGPRAPCRPCTLRGLHRALRLRGAHARHGAEHGAGRRIVHGDAVAPFGVDPAAVDVALLAEEL